MVGFIFQLKSNNLATTTGTIVYPVMEHFYTLQGEGVHTGKAAYFIRLGGCDVGCVWCDVKESWDAAAHPQLSVDEIVTVAASFPGRLAVITGGEPAMHDLAPLVAALKEKGFRTHIETSGAYDIQAELDWITLSPKKFKFPIDATLLKADELKVVVYHPSDLKWAETHLNHLKSDCKLFLQPEWSKKDVITPLIIEYIKEHPAWQLSLQTHKYINIP
jgi:7-carboxy-7-deazaguanine synthase